MKQATLIIRNFALSASVTSWYWFSTNQKDGSQNKYLFALYWITKGENPTVWFCSLVIGPFKFSFGRAL